jgi:hypothetical protein
LAPLIAGLIFIGTSISRDLADLTLGSAWPYVLLGLALLVALGFEFVNGFHDAANAVATLHAFTGSQYRRGVVGILEFRRRRDFVRRGCLWHRFLVAGGIGFARASPWSSRY